MFAFGDVAVSSLCVYLTLLVDIFHLELIRASHDHLIVIMPSCMC